MVSSSSFSGSISDGLGQVSIFSAATGEAVLIKDLWDQDEVGSFYLFHYGCLNKLILCSDNRFFRGVGV
jgi:hypothetical protein